MKFPSVVMQTRGDGCTKRTEKCALHLDGNPAWEQAHLEPNAMYACLMVRIPDGWEIEPDPRGKTGLRFWTSPWGWSPTFGPADGTGCMYIRPTSGVSGCEVAALDEARAKLREAKVAVSEAMDALTQARADQGGES